MALEANKRYKAMIHIPPTVSGEEYTYTPTQAIDDIVAQLNEQGLGVSTHLFYDPYVYRPGIVLPDIPGSDSGAAAGIGLSCNVNGVISANAGSNGGLKAGAIYSRQDTDPLVHYILNSNSKYIVYDGASYTVGNQYVERGKTIFLEINTEPLTTGNFYIVSYATYPIAATAEDYPDTLSMTPCFIVAKADNNHQSVICPDVTSTSVTIYYNTIENSMVTFEVSPVNYYDPRKIDLYQVHRGTEKYNLYLAPSKSDYGALRCALMFEENAKDDTDIVVPNVLKADGHIYSGILKNDRLSIVYRES